MLPSPAFSTSCLSKSRLQWSSWIYQHRRCEGSPQRPTPALRYALVARDGAVARANRGAVPERRMGETVKEADLKCVERKIGKEIKSVRSKALARWPAQLVPLETALRPPKGRRY